MIATGVDSLVNQTYICYILRINVFRHEEMGCVYGILVFKQSIRRFSRSIPHLLNIRFSFPSFFFSTTLLEITHFYCSKIVHLLILVTPPQTAFVLRLRFACQLFLCQRTFFALYCPHIFFRSYPLFGKYLFGDITLC
jgi:hypothetical protein